MPSVLKLDTIKSLAGNEAATINEAGRVTFNSQLVQPTPYFKVYRTTNQSLSSGISAAVQFNSVNQDPYGWWNSGSYKWVPQIAGYYHITTILHLSGSSITRRICQIVFDGDDDIRAFDTSSASGVDIMTGGGIGYFNGTTDGVTVTVTVTATSPLVTGVEDGSYARFEGFLVRAT